MIDDTADDWKTLATALHEHGGIPERRAEVVALLATTEMTHAEIKNELGLNNRSNVAAHARRYREDDYAPAKWLAENGPEI